jgi:hypothetical protein
LVPDTATHYRWACLGKYGGDNVTCSAPKACGGSRNTCTVGTVNDEVVEDTTTEYR